MKSLTEWLLLTAFLAPLTVIGVLAANELLVKYP